MTFRLLSTAAVTVVIAMAGVSPASASISVGFTNISNNSGVAAAVASQLHVQINDLGGGQIQMVLTNNVGIASNVAEFYIDDGTIVGLSSVQNSLTGFTNFVSGAQNRVSPGNLPGGNSLSPPFAATTMFSADTVAGPPRNGVDSAIDSVGFVYDLLPGLTFADVRTALNTGELRIGLHVRSIGQDSDSFVNTGGPAVPEPSTLVVWVLLSIFGGVFYLRKRSRS